MTYLASWPCPSTSDHCVSEVVHGTARMAISDQISLMLMHNSTIVMHCCMRSGQMGAKTATSPADRQTLMAFQLALPSGEWINDSKHTPLRYLAFPH